MVLMALVVCVKSTLWWWTSCFMIAVLWLITGCLSQDMTTLAQIPLPTTTSDGHINIRLVNGLSLSSRQGRVEFFNEGRWNTVCDEAWNTQGAKVVCRQLGFSADGAVARYGAYFGRGSGWSWVVQCNGQEAGLDSCAFSTSQECYHADDAGVECGDPATTNDPFVLTPTVDYERSNIRLMDGDSSAEGRVEIFYNGQWNTICNNSWGVEEAQVVCRQLGYGNVARSSVSFGPGTGPIQQAPCSGWEPRLDYCILTSGLVTCSHTEDIGVECEGTDIRLTNGESPNEGRVEVFYNNEWNTICDESWGLEEANVVCRQLGYNTNHVVARIRAHFGEGSQLSPIQSVQCNGDESSLDDCIFATSNTRCYHYQDAGVECGESVQGSTTLANYEPTNIRLVDGDSPREGRVEIFYDGQWNTLCRDTWGVEDARVVCRQLGYDMDNVTRSSYNFGQGTGPLRYVNCYGNETRLDACYLNIPVDASGCHHEEHAGVQCGRGTTCRAMEMMSFMGVSLSLLTVATLVSAI